MQWTQTEPFKLRRAGSLKGFRKEGFIPAENKPNATNNRDTLNGIESVNNYRNHSFSNLKSQWRGNRTNGLEVLQLRGKWTGLQ